MAAMTEPSPDVEPEDAPEPTWREVTVVADHDGEQRKHVFRVRLDLDYKDITAVTRFNARGGDGLSMLPTIDRVLRRSMLDDDGVPARWEPSVSEGHFTAPDGTAQPVARLREFLAFEAGSSSRRWRALLADDDVSLDPGVMMDAWNELMGGAAERPTRR